jgi:hypothetical protein
MFQITTIACGKGPHIGTEHWGTISYAAAQFKDRNLLLNPIPSTVEALHFFLPEPNEWLWPSLIIQD